MAQRSAEGVGMTNATARPPHRRERLYQWMEAEGATCTVLFGADHATHLTGYARYFGGPSAVVVGAEGDCVLVVMQDEAPVARSAASAAEAAAQIASGAPIEFTCDLLSGPNTADVCCPIHVAGTRVVEAGDVVIADVVVRSNGYWGDTAETHAVGASAEGAEARALLLDVLEEARTMLVPGAKGSSVFEHVHARIVEALPGGELPHHAGHGLGLGAFEDPHLIPSDDTPLEPWMVLAVEPGVYFPGAGNVGGKAADVRPEDRVASGDPGRYGARVENVFVVTPAGGVELRRLLAEA